MGKNNCQTYAQLTYYILFCNSTPSTLCRANKHLLKEWREIQYLFSQVHATEDSLAHRS